jgi:hypothetical protein
MFRNNMKKMLPFGILIILSTFILGKPAREVYKTENPPVIDGKLDDPVWNSALQFTGFKTFEPDHGKDLSQKTIAYAAYDEENFYFAFRCYEKDPKKIKASVTKRDNMFDHDWIGLIIDTFNDQQMGFGFFINPLGIQGDGTMNIKGNFNDNLDMVWYSKGRIDEEGWTAEYRIPFKSIRFPNKKKLTMGLGFFRCIVRTSETGSFPEIAPDKGAFLSQSQPITVTGIKYKRVVEVLPAFTHSQKSAHEDGKFQRYENQSDISLTAKFGITSDVVLDAAYNPDFNQVEADAGQVDVNLRYDLYFSEKRPFFLEGKDSFQLAGNTEDAPLYSIVHTRRIVDPILGVKLAGKLGRRNTINAIYAVDEVPDEDGNIDKANFSVLRFRHSLKDDSYLGGFYTGREFLGGYNRVAGVDGRFRLSPISIGAFHFFGSHDKDHETGEKVSGHAMAARYSLGNRKYQVEVGYQDISENFKTDTGFLNRDGIGRLALFGMYNIFPKSKFFQRISPFYWSYHIYDKYSNMFETFNLFTLRFHMPGQSQFRIDMIMANEVYEGQRFNRSGIGFQFYSQFTRKLSGNLFYRHNKAIYYDEDDPYQGKQNRVNFGLNYEPTENLSTALSLSYADFYRESDSEKIYDYTILRSRTTYQLNKYLFFRGILEYNTYWDKLTADFLASFTYIPGTVVHLGYGSVFEKLEWQNDEYITSDRFLETKRGFFFKVSYLWRL